MKNIAGWLLIVVVAVVVVAVVMTQKEEESYTNTCGDAVEKFCDKHYGRDQWFFDSIHTFNDQLVFAVIRTFDGGQTDLSILPQSRAMIIESTTSAKTPARRVHRF